MESKVWRERESGREREIMIVLSFARAQRECGECTTCPGECLVLMLMILAYEGWSVWGGSMVTSVTTVREHVLSDESL